MLLYNQSSPSGIDSTARNRHWHLAATNTTNSNSTSANDITPESRSLDSDHDQDSLGLIVACSVLGFLLFDVVLLTWYTWHHFRPTPSNNNNNNNNTTPQKLFFKTLPYQSKLERLEKAAPTQRLDAWWKIEFICAICLGFNSAICLEAVDGSQTIHDIKCHHVFHDRCLEGWFVECHFDCPLCHAVFFRSGNCSGSTMESTSNSGNMV
ncbi:hypothetical protein VTN00DRAFT_6056 [Thermoascus crustaceus]|uniref:uncharacterized protein n=1 Tax=Thermoascus crustaceus TaxID=5088 RepID=UPI0037437204